jgi:hypothetical protein
MSPETIARIEGEQTRLRLARYPELQAEALAHHYTRVASLAILLEELTKIRRLDGPDKDTDKVIGFIMEDIKEAHLKDLGIPLEWKCDETLYRDSCLTADEKSVE